MASGKENNKKNNLELASQIFDDYGDFIYSVICAKVQNEEKADDIYQDFFLSLISKPISPGIKNIKGFLYRAIINDITDSYRRVDRYKTNIQKYNQKIKTSINKRPSRNAFKEKEEIKEMLKLIQEQLPSSCSQAIILRYGDNLSIKEIAKKMNVKSSSVSRYISKGLKMLRRLLTGK
jgi:RNA polymerase sigma-70 factor (ECF subfamily)